MLIKVTREISFDENDDWHVDETIALIKKLTANGFNFSHMLPELKKLSSWLKDENKRISAIEYDEFPD
jgi:hypothetical protein